ncbi:RNA polymerase sigma factor [Streptomyces sp. TS71-3]|uniref:RNA polymerase sigma factor n=1 Tax=Streptomyces sp. TS71-3 TaxID=2733862 RepID=UPI001BB354BA|nr:RNA polymerase sigma factor [Streptomyces sp. TS71-3]
MDAVHDTASRPAGGRRAGHAREAAAAELFAAVYPRLAGWCRSLVRSNETAHEIAAEAFTRLWSRWGTVDAPVPYLYSIASNLVKQHWRRTDRERQALRKLTREATEPAPAADRGMVIKHLVQGLPERLRVPVLLHYYAGLTIAEIATTLHRRPGTVKSDLHDARQMLRAELRGLHETTT